MREIETLPEGITCRVYRKDKLIFESSSHWLHPLFELDAFLSSSPEDSARRNELFLADRVIGRAAALMIARLGIRNCSAPLVSGRALPVLEEYNIACRYEKLIPRIECRTEDILAEETDTHKAWDLLAERAARAKEAGRDR